MGIEIDLTVRGLSPVQTERMMSVLKKFLNEEQQQAQVFRQEIHEAVTSIAPAPHLQTVNEPATQTAQEAAGEPQDESWGEDTPAETDEVPAAPVAAQEAPTRTKQAIDETKLRSMKVTELKRICEVNAVPLPAKATKDALVAAIIEHCSVPSGTASATEVAPSTEVPTEDPWGDESNVETTDDGWGDEAPADPWADEPAA